MNPDDWNGVAGIFKQGIETQDATFEQTVPTWEIWDARQIKSCRIVAEIEKEIVGWVALSPLSKEIYYSGVAISSIYVSEKYRGMKIGSLLLKELIKESEKHNFWTLQAGIFPENIASLKIHQENGYMILGLREKLGKMNAKWRDSYILERRSKIVGID